MATNSKFIIITFKWWTHKKCQQYKLLKTTSIWSTVSEQVHRRPKQRSTICQIIQVNEVIQTAMIENQNGKRGIVFPQFLFKQKHKKLKNNIFN